LPWVKTVLLYKIVFKNNFYKKVIYAVWFMLMAGNLLADDGRLNLNGIYPVLEAENKIWIGTPSGLYQYSSDEDSYKHYILPIAGQSQQIHYMYYFDEWIWCVLDSNLAALHIRLNEWLVFNKENGLPSNSVNGIDFSEDYVWISTNKGAARYDLLIEEWEEFSVASGLPEMDVKDVVVKDDNVWLITNSYFSEYNPRFEKWRHYRVEADSTAINRRGFFLGEEFWLVTQKGMVLFNTTLQTQQDFFLPYLKQGELIDIFIENETIWAISRSGLYYYNQTSGVWREFEGNHYLQSSTILNGSVDATEIWVLTHQNVLVYSRVDKNWEIIDYASGLSSTGFESSYIQGGTAFLSRSEGIDYRLGQDSRWRSYEILPHTGDPGLSARNIAKNLFDNESGGYLPVGKYKWSWEGSRMTYIYDYEQTFYSSDSSSDPKTISGERLDIKNQLLLGKTRSLSGFYNNIDYSETMYGIRYRSREKDILREFNWGDFKREPGNIPFGESASMFGSNIWLQAGKKTDRFKRSLVSLKAQAGQRRSQKTYESFNGAFKAFELDIRDTDFSKNEFFKIPGLDTSQTVENMEIYVDDLIASGNTENTLSGYSIGGITGDFDILKSTEDYYFYKKAGVIRFTGFRNNQATIVVRYSQNNQIHEEILQYGNVISTIQYQFYSLRGQQIIPYSFQFEIIDTTGAEVPLSQFGLDQNNDGRVDPRWVDYENGILFFPEEKPFPDVVYESVGAKSVYSMNAKYETEYALIQLAHNDLVRGTAELKLEGIIAKGGNDYVLDYTNGTLVFVREGVVNEDTRIELEYEYYLEDVSTDIYGATVNISPSDNLYIQADWARFNTTDSTENITEETEDLVSVHSEIRQRAGNYDIRVIPGIAYQNEEGELTAYHVEGLVSSPRVRMQTRFENFNRNYKNLYRPKSIVGDVKSDLEIFSSVDIRKDLRVSGKWNDQKGFSDPGTAEPGDRTANITLLFHHQNLPGWQGSYQDQESKTDAGLIRKHFFLNNLEYQLPQKVLENIWIKSLKTEAQYRHGKQSGLVLAGTNQQEFSQGYIRINSNFSNQFQSSLFYRRNSLHDISDRDLRAEVNRSERMLFNISHEKWRTLQLNLRVENTLDQGFHAGGEQNTSRLSQYSQFNARFSPGQIWQKLTALHFEFNMNQSLYGWGNQSEAVSNWAWQFFRNKTNNLTNSQLIRNYYLKNEFRPGLNYYLYSLFEWNNQDNQYSGSGLQSNYWQLNEKLEVKVGYETRVYVQYRQFNQDLGYKRINQYYEPSVWTEHRWTPNFQNILYALYRYTDSKDGNVGSQMRNVEGRYDIIWRQNEFIGIRRLELRQSLSASHTQISGNGDEENYRFTSGTALDIYPLHSMIFRFQFNASRYVNPMDSNLNNISIDFNTKLSLRF